MAFWITSQFLYLVLGIFSLPLSKMAIVSSKEKVPEFPVSTMFTTESILNLNSSARHKYAIGFQRHLDGFNDEHVRVKRHGAAYRKGNQPVDIRKIEKRTENEESYKKESNKNDDTISEPDFPYNHRGSGLDLDSVRQFPNIIEASNVQVRDGIKKQKRNVRRGKYSRQYGDNDGGNKRYLEDNDFELDLTNEGDDGEIIISQESAKTPSPKIPKLPKEKEVWHRVNGNLENSIKPLCKLYMSNEKNVEALLAAALNAERPSVHRSLLTYCTKMEANNYVNGVKSNNSEEGFLSKALSWINKNLGFKGENGGDVTTEKNAGFSSNPELIYDIRPNNINLIISPDVAKGLQETIKTILTGNNLKENSSYHLNEDLWRDIEDILMNEHVIESIREIEENLSQNNDLINSIPSLEPPVRRPTYKRSIGTSCQGQKCELENIRNVLKKIASTAYDTSSDTEELAQLIFDHVKPPISARNFRRKKAPKIPRRTIESLNYDSGIENGETYPQALKFFENFTLPPAKEEGAVDEGKGGLPYESQFEGSIEHGTKNLHEVDEMGIFSGYIMRHLVAFTVCGIVVIVIVLLPVAGIVACWRWLMRSRRKYADSDSEACYLDVNVSDTSVPRLNEAGPKKSRTKSHKEDRYSWLNTDRSSKEDDDD